MNAKLKGKSYNIFWTFSTCHIRYITILHKTSFKDESNDHRTVGLSILTPNAKYSEEDLMQSFVTNLNRNTFS